MRVFKELDRILRGDATRPGTLQTDGIKLPVVSVSLLLIVLGMVYGACMGVFSLTSTGSGQHMQIVASIVKVPLLFLLTLIVTMPSLYVFNALVGSRLAFGAFLKLMVGAMAVLLAVLASLGPIVAFFSVSTTSYAFMVVLNVVIFAISGFLGLSFLLQTLHRLTLLEDARLLEEAAKSAPPAAAPWEDPPVPASDPSMPAVITEPQLPSFEVPTRSPIERLEGQILGKHVKNVFRIWVIVFGLVGAQMGWVLRPFIGSPTAEFEWVREREGNFFESVTGHIKRLFDSEGKTNDRRQRGDRSANLPLGQDLLAADNPALPADLRARLRADDGHVQRAFGQATATALLGGEGADAAAGELHHRAAELLRDQHAARAAR